MAETSALRAVADSRWNETHRRIMDLVSKIEHPGFRKGNTMSKINVVMNHIVRTGSISIREAMADYGISGGSLTKYISILRNQYNWDIKREFRKHPITGTRYARYSMDKNALKKVA
jgi:hypothetical protein